MLKEGEKEFIPDYLIAEFKHICPKCKEITKISYHYFSTGLYSVFDKVPIFEYNDKPCLMNRICGETKRIVMVPQYKELISKNTKNFQRNFILTGNPLYDHEIMIIVDNCMITSLYRKEYVVEATKYYRNLNIDPNILDREKEVVLKNYIKRTIEMRMLKKIRDS